MPAILGIAQHLRDIQRCEVDARQDVAHDAVAAGPGAGPWNRLSRICAPERIVMALAGTSTMGSLRVAGPGKDLAAVGTAARKSIRCTSIADDYGISRHDLDHV
ncbi:MAG: hypothetical protein WDO24_12535 [Pseudomonadota bacterium]